MNVNKVIFAQAIRFITLKSEVYVPDIIEQLRKRYGFVRLPVTAEDLLPANDKPVTLGHGRFVHDTRTIIVRNLDISRNLIAVETGTETDDADLVVEDILTAGVDLVTPIEARLYRSQLEVVLEPQLGELFPRLGRALASVLTLYGAPEPPPFQVSVFGMSIDPSQFTLPCDFRIERRANFTYDQNVYFAQAPMRTADHIVTLREFEAALAGVKPKANV
jgi:hypothetical protein